MKKELLVKKSDLSIPIALDGKETVLSIYLQDEAPVSSAGENRQKIMEFLVPVRECGDEESYSCDYFAPIPVKQFTGKTLILEGDVPRAFLERAEITAHKKAGALERPSIHFTPERGWMNDPNGLLFHKGRYHLYFQYNPFHIIWNNMSWGHAVSTDLLHWTQQDSVLFPDENGLMFSGSGIRNERSLLDLPKDALLFYYTAAGGAASFSREAPYTQRLAYSLDGGNTFIKTDRGRVEMICKENRDPKLFWHEESRAYVMCLWLEKNDFGILRSADLETWTLSQRLTLESAWECPDLLRVPVEGGEKQWIFWSADGFYYMGEFDGYTFRTDGRKKEAYATKLPYAAQTFAGIADRIISVVWLRTENAGRLYRGAMGLPVELIFVKTPEGLALSKRPVREYEEQKRLYFEKTAELLSAEEQTIFCRLPQNGAFELQTKNGLGSDHKLCWLLGTDEVSYDSESGEFTFIDQTVLLEKEIGDFSFLVDDTIFEVFANRGIIYAAFELERPIAGKNARITGAVQVRVFNGA